MPEPASYDICPAKPEIRNLVRWQQAQNGHLESIDRSLRHLCEEAAKRRGAEGMIKWVLGVVGITGVIAVLNLFKGVLGLG